MANEQNSTRYVMEKVWIVQTVNTVHSTNSGYFKYKPISAAPKPAKVNPVAKDNISGVPNPKLKNAILQQSTKFEMENDFKGEWWEVMVIVDLVK